MATHLLKPATAVKPGEFVLDRNQVFQEVVSVDSKAGGKTSKFLTINFVNGAIYSCLSDDTVEYLPKAK